MSPARKDPPAEPAPEHEPDPEKLRAMVEAEAAAAEGTEADRDAPAAEPEPEPDPRHAELAAARATFLERVGEILGPEGEVRPCSLCEGAGFVPLELPQSATRERCADCEGFGSVRTGSLVETQAVLPCETCNGNGWTALAAPIVLPDLTPAPALVAAAGNSGANPAPIVPDVTGTRVP